MKINKSLLIDFLKKSSLNGEIDELVLDFSATGLKVRAKDRASTVVVASKIDTGSFKEYKPLNVKYGFKGISKILSVLRNFKDEINLVINKENMTVSFSDDKKKMSFQILEPEYVDSYITKLPETDITNEFIISSEMFHNIQTVCKAYSSVMTIEIKDKKIYFSSDLGTLGEYIERDELEYKNLKLHFGVPLFNVINILGDKIYLSLEENKPLIIKEKLDGLFIKYIIAPREEN